MIWLGTLIGVVARSADGVQGIAFVTVFPLTFVANTFVPVGGFPKASVRSPNTTRSAPGRRRCGPCSGTDRDPLGAAWPLEHPVLAGLLWCVAILAVVVPLTLRAYRRRTTG